MAGLGDLSDLLCSIEPELHDAPYGFGLMQDVVRMPEAFAKMVAEEGVSVVATEAISAALTGQGISANVAAGCNPDHILVQWLRQHDAVSALDALR